MQSLGRTKLAIINQSYYNVSCNTVLLVKELLVKPTVSIHFLNLLALFNGHTHTNQDTVNVLQSFKECEQLISANDTGFQNLYKQ